jgi:hypothetical protein
MILMEGAAQQKMVTLLEAIGFVVAMALLAPVGACENDGASCYISPRQSDEPSQFQNQPVQTGKERLGRKFSDEQRVDNCNVPFDLRGSRPRPDDCTDDVNRRSGR